MLAPALVEFWEGEEASGPGGGGTPSSGPPTGGGIDFQPGTSSVRVNWTDPVSQDYVQVGVYMDNTTPSPIEPDWIIASIADGVETYSGSGALYQALSLNYLRDGTSLIDWWVRSVGTDGSKTSWVYCGNSRPGAD